MKNKVQLEGPKIYVACLAAYNAGQLHGVWISAEQEVQEIQAAINSMLKNSPEASAEEWAVHDYEGFNTISLSEWSDIERVSILAKLIIEHGQAFSIWYENQDGDNFDVSELDDKFLEQWQGVYDSETDFAYEIIEESGQLSQLPAWALNYFNYENYARDLKLSGDFSFTYHDCQTYVFSNF